MYSGCDMDILLVSSKKCAPAGTRHIATLTTAIKTQEFKQHDILPGRCDSLHSQGNSSFATSSEAIGRMRGMVASVSRLRRHLREDEIAQVRFEGTKRTCLY